MTAQANDCANVWHSAALGTLSACAVQVACSSDSNIRSAAWRISTGSGAPTRSAYRITS